MAVTTMRNSILVTGKNGQLGRSLQKIAGDYPQYEFTFIGRDELDLSRSQSIASYFLGKHFDIIINCAAYTAVDKAETEPELADQINHRAVKQIAQIAKLQEATLIHISTDYVFNGQNYRPYIETDTPDPQSVYGRSKLKGELAIQKVNPHAIIIRTSWVYSEFGNNFVKTMLRLGREKSSINVIYDQIGSPTYAGDLAKVILNIISFECINDELPRLHLGAAEKKVSIYHYSNEGVCSWYDFAKSIFELTDIKCQVNPIESKDYPTPAKRPYYSLLNKSKIKSNVDIKTIIWRESLGVCLKLIEKNKMADF